MLRHMLSSRNLSLLAAMLFCVFLAIKPGNIVLADGGGFPTDTPRPTATVIFTQSPDKGLGSTSSQAIATATPTQPVQAASSAAGSAPSVSSGQVVPTGDSSLSAPTAGAPNGETSQTSSSIPMLAIVGTAVLATVGVIGVVLILRRRR